MIDSKKYIFTLILTLAIFATAFFVSGFISDKRVADVKSIQDNISIDILSNETQFDLLNEVSCSNLNDTILSPELSNLGDKLSSSETERGAKDTDIVYLKKYYSLLEIKDYLLSKKLAEKCSSKKSASIIYFYSNIGDCEDCEKEGFVLTFLKEKYPDLRIYSFDYNLSLSAVNSMKKIYKIDSGLPALVIGDKTYFGYKTIDQIEAMLPSNLKKAVVSKTATSTTSSTNK